LPGEICKIPVSTSVKPCVSNQVLKPRVMALLAARNGLTSACRAADHQGEEGSLTAVTA
jgi:hypothetical protein